MFYHLKIFLRSSLQRGRIYLVIFLQMRHVKTMHPGYNREQAVLLELPMRTLLASGWDNVKPMVQSMKHELQTLPALTGVAVCDRNIVYNPQYSTGGADWAGREADFNPAITYLSADADYMRLMVLHFIEGQCFEAFSFDEKNVILTETAVRKLKIPEPYIGQRFEINSQRKTGGEIIGVVKDFHFRIMHEPITPLVMFTPSDFASMITIKTHPGLTVQALEAVNGVWQKFFPNDAFEYKFLDDTFNELHRADIRISRLMLVFSILAIMIAALGLFGLTTFTIERRTKEIGIHKVLGASVSRIVYILTREFLILVAVAFAIAAPISYWAMSRWLQNFAYRIDITVWIFVAGAVLTLVIALAAVGIQAVRAATDNPVKAIKRESDFGRQPDF